MAIVRSIENGFSQIRPTHEARSIAVDPYGRLVASQEASEGSARVLIADVPGSGVTTVYARVGDVFAYLAIVILMSLSAAAILSRVRPQGVARERVTISVPSEVME